MTMMTARLAVLVFGLSFAVTASAVPAQADEGWVITSFAAGITIHPDSSLSIVEDIHVDFGTLQKHGIFRYIPVRYRYDSTRDRYYYLKVQSVTDGARPLPYTTYLDGPDQVIKIGDPNVLVSGANRYVITYTVAGAMNAFADHDELFWNVDGGQWPVAKRSVTAVMNVPANSFQKAACYQGPSGSVESCNFTTTSSSVTFSSTRILASGEQMSAVTALNKGVVSVPPPLLESRSRSFPADAFDVNPLTLGLAALILIAGLGVIAWLWWQHGRDRELLTRNYAAGDTRDRIEPLFQHEPVVVEFGPPQDLKAAQLGLILDESADTKDVTATIVDLAVRGHMTITEVDGAKDWLLTWKSNDASSLLPYERTLLDGLFTGRQQVKLSELKGTFHATLQKAEGNILDDAMSRKLFTSRPDYARGRWGCLGIIVVAAGGFATYQLGINFGWGLVGLAVLVVGAVLLITSRQMPQRTAAGRDVMQHALGFRLYMNTAEKYRQQFAEKAEIFTQLLPYAIVFGCVTRWAKAFEGIDTSASNNWYVGNAPFQAAVLASSLQSMNSSISSAISASPPNSGSSSGFGGGGSSGGGGGGGGGGSW
ncbi:MAG TPA: DUF2207 domain-containing protein [Candidatus Dormibacteraeota bacterium]